MLRTAGITLFYSLVFFALLSALCVLLFPYQSMRFYMDCGNELRAFECADNYINREKNKPHTYDDRYTGALYTASNLAVGLAGKGNVKAAVKADAYIRAYLSIENIELKNKEIDAYNLRHASPALHPGLYSVAAYLDRAAFECRTIAGDFSELSIGVTDSKAGEILLGPIGYETEEAVCRLFANLSAYADMGGDLINGPYKGAYDAIKTNFARVRNFALNYPQDNGLVLKQCRFTGTIAGFVSRAKQTPDAAFWAQMDTGPAAEGTIGDFYTALLEEYLNLYK